MKALKQLIKLLNKHQEALQEHDLQNMKFIIQHEIDHRRAEDKNKTINYVLSLPPEQTYERLRSLINTDLNLLFDDRIIGWFVQNAELVATKTKEGVK